MCLLAGLLTVHKVNRLYFTVYGLVPIFVHPCVAHFIPVILFSGHKGQPVTTYQGSFDINFLPIL